MSHTTRRIGLGEARVIKTEDTSIANDAVMTADPELRFAARPNAVYFVRARLRFVVTATTNDLAWQFTVPAGASMTGFDLVNDANVTHSGSSFITSTSHRLAALEMELVTGSAGGLVSFDWCQSPSDAATLTVLKGSYLEYERLI